MKVITKNDDNNNDNNNKYILGTSHIKCIVLQCSGITNGSREKVCDKRKHDNDNNNNILVSID
jgi:hypothetical protein